MKAVAEKVRNVLLGSVGLTALVQTRIYWEKGPDNDVLPLIAFSISETPGLSKDRTEHVAIIKCYADNTDEASDMYDFIKPAMLSEQHKFRGAQSGITDDERREAVIEATFTII